MSDAEGEHLTGEPQTERGPVGSRDTGSDGPSGGPVARPAGTADQESDSSVDPQRAQDSDIQLPTGDGG